MLGTQRFSDTAEATITQLGPLAQLPGVWIGSGFNVISRPDKQDDKPFFLELNETHETLTFTAIGSNIPNRGSLQDDIELFGIHYLQQISDAVTHGALHIEPGIWLTVPPTSEPAQPDSTVVRLATIPHGDALMAQGTSHTPADGQPDIATEDTTPLTSSTQVPITNPKYLLPFQQTQATAPRITVADIKNPNLVLQAAIQQQKIINTTALIVDTAFAGPAQAGDIRNIPFVTSNANAMSMRSVFWIEEVDHPFRPGSFLQLQYTQRVILRFNGIDWPHVSVATLIKI